MRVTKRYLLGRLIKHALSTAKYSIYYGNGRDQYDTEAGRTTHEAIFNTNDGQFRCPNSQQGFSGFTTWTRGLVGLPGLLRLEFISILADEELEPYGGKESLTKTFLKAAKSTADFYINNSAIDGIPYWDTGAPSLINMPEAYLDNVSDPTMIMNPLTAGSSHCSPRAHQAWQIFK